MNEGYPKEMVHESNGAIVLFSAPGVGIVIDPGNGSYRIGEHLVDADMDDYVLMGESL